MLGFIAGFGAAATAGGVAGYASMAPQSQLFGSTFIRGKNLRQLALTFDDGPNDPYTLQLLDVLACHNVKATFFLIGRYVAQRPDIARAIAQAGHVIGNHSHTHPVLPLCSQKKILKELADCENALQTAVGGHSKLFRPPFGARTPSVLRRARAKNLVPVMWSVTCYDWKSIAADRIASHAIRQIRGGDVILLHDGGHLKMGAARAHTVEAADRLIRRYKDQGFAFVTVPEMMLQD